MIEPHFDADEECKAPESREDNLSPNAGFMKEYPLWVVFFGGAVRAPVVGIFEESCHCRVYPGNPE